MKKYIALIIALTLFLPAARAQTAVPYTTMQQQPADTPATAAAPFVNPNPLVAPAPTAAPSSGHTPITDEMAKAYYDQCVGKPQAPMSADTQASFCSCTADRMKQTMTVEDKQVLAQNDQEGRNMLNSMLLNVYAPCMNFPVQDLLENQCLQDMKNKPLPPGMDMGKICHCMATKTGSWFTTNGRDLMEQVLKANPNITDPMGPVTEDPSFKKASSDNLTSCLTGGAAP